MPTLIRKAAAHCRSPRWRSLCRAVSLGVLCAGLVLGACGGSGTFHARGASYVLKPDLVHYGASYSEWAVRWVQWAYEIPLDNHPLFDTVGTDVGVGQVDPVWFLGGVFGELAVPTEARAERTIDVPYGVALFFPILNAIMDNVGCLPEDWGPDKSSTELREFAYDLVNEVGDIYCYVDGDKIIDTVGLAGAVEFRAIAAEFSAYIPANNLFVGLCGDPPLETVVTPIATDGIWMMLGPMQPGMHELHFGGAFPNYGPFIIDITYHVNVLPDP